MKSLMAYLLKVNPLIANQLAKSGVVLTRAHVLQAVLHVVALLVKAALQAIIFILMHVSLLALAQPLLLMLFANLAPLDVPNVPQPPLVKLVI